MISVGAYGIIKTAKDGITAYKKFKNGSTCISTIREIVIYKTLEHNKLDHLFLKIIRYKPHKIYMEKYKTNLNEVSFKPGIITLSSKIDILYKLLVSLHALHSINVIHGDIKPENILWNSETDIKVIDFGISNLGGYNRYTSIPQSNNIYTLYWKPPEIISDSIYTNKADIWAMALVFIRVLVFIDEASYVPLLNKLFNNIKNLPFGEQYRATHNILRGIFSRPDTERFADLFSNELIFDLIINMILPNPKARYDINACLSHKLFSSYEKPVISLYPYPKKYSLIETRTKSLEKIYNIAIDNNLSYQIVMHSFILYDNIYTSDINIKLPSVELSCIYISCALYYSHHIFGGGILDKKEILSILELLDYNIYYTNYVDELINEINKDFSVEVTFKNIFKDYINMRL